MSRDQPAPAVLPRWIRYPVLGLLLVGGAIGLLFLVLDPGDQLITGRAVAPLIIGLLLTMTAGILLLRIGRTRLVLIRRLDDLGAAAQAASRSQHDEAAEIGRLSARGSQLLVVKRPGDAAGVVAELRSRRPQLRTTQLEKPYDEALRAAEKLGKRSAAIERRQARHGSGQRDARG